MRYLLCIGLAATFVGADCGNPSGLTRTCAGATVQSLKFSLIDGCGGSDGVIGVNVANAGQCAITVVESSSVPLPTTGTFGEAAGATSYDLAKGNWTLQPPTTGMIGDSGGLQCTAGTPTAGGDITLTCNITQCSQVGEDLEPTCMVTGACMMHLAPAPADAPVGSPDASTAQADASVAQDGAVEDAPKSATGG